MDAILLNIMNNIPAVIRDNAVAAIIVAAVGIIILKITSKIIKLILLVALIAFIIVYAVPQFVNVG